jgi:glycosyltransferase involved in cell wall biosynthesis
LNIAKALGNQHWDLLFIDHWLMLPVLDFIRATRRVLLLHNAEPALILQGAKQLPVPESLVARLEARRARSYLRRVVPQVDELHLLSYSDLAALERDDITHQNVHVFLPEVDTLAESPPSFIERKATALFVGTLSWEPNRHGLRWLLADGLTGCPSLEYLDVCGNGVDDAIRTMCNGIGRIVIRGFVPDLASYYAKARVFVAPLVFGSGIKIKILDSLAYGVPVVTTPAGIEGFPEQGIDCLAVEDSPGAFWRATERLLSDSSEWGQRSYDGRRYLERHFSGSGFRRWCSEAGSLRGGRRRDA